MVAAACGTHISQYVYSHTAHIIIHHHTVLPLHCCYDICVCVTHHTHHIIITHILGATCAPHKHIIIHHYHTVALNFCCDICVTHHTHPRRYMCTSQTYHNSSSSHSTSQLLLWYMCVTYHTHHRRYMCTSQTHHNSSSHSTSQLLLWYMCVCVCVYTGNTRNSWFFRKGNIIKYIRKYPKISENIWICICVCVCVCVCVYVFFFIFFFSGNVT